MSHKKIEDLLVWQESRQLVLDVYKLFKSSRDYSFRDQIQRAVISVMNNIAEGYERSGDKEFKYFLFVAKGSCGEVRSMLYVAKDLGYLSDKQFEDTYNQAEKVSKMLAGFIKKL